MAAADLDTLNSTQTEGVKNLGLIYQAILSMRLINFVPVPANSAANGTVGQVAADTSFLYICVATNLWRRVAIAAF